MAEFIPWAGFSPSCWAVFVQTEHWAPTFAAEKSVREKDSSMRKKYFIAAGKGTAVKPIGIQCLTEKNGPGCLKKLQMALLCSKYN